MNKNYVEDKSIIDSYLKNNDADSRDKLIDFVCNEHFEAEYKNQNDMSYMMLIIDIYKMEKDAGKERTILDLSDNMDGLISKFIELKFLIWRIEFAGDDILNRKLLNDWLKYNRPSAYMLMYVADVASLDGKKTVNMINDVIKGS